MDRKNIDRLNDRGKTDRYEEDSNKPKVHPTFIDTYQDQRS